MSTDAQIAANRQNAQSSTGPRTEPGKSAASHNALTLGLYTRADYVQPEERDLYKEFCETLYTELSPDGLLEESFVSEITGATWRLRRCSAIEAVLAHNTPEDPILDEATEKTLRSIDRARSHAHNLLNRSVNQLRRIQTDRFCRLALNANGDDAGLSDFRQVVTVTNNRERGKFLEAKSTGLIMDNAIARAMRPGPEPADTAFSDELASICKPPEPAENTTQPARNAPCPCQSGQKYKNCCARTGPGWPSSMPLAGQNAYLSAS